MDLLKRRLMMLPTDEPYIRFADPVAEEFCATSFGDGVGLTKRKARKVTTAQFKTELAGFADRTQITSFNEFKYFDHVREAGNWSGCSLLASITLPRSVTLINWNAFENCTALESINLSNIVNLRGRAFYGCTNLRIVVDIPNLQNVSASTSIDYEAFRQSGITKVANLGTITSLGSYSSFAVCPNLTEIWIPRTVKNIERFSLYQDPSLVTVVVLATTPPSLYNAAAIGGAADRKIYVPYSSDHSILDSYKAAPSWSSLANAIFELNPDGTVPTA